MQTKLILFPGLISQIPTKWRYLFMITVLLTGQMSLWASNDLLSEAGQQQQIAVTGTVIDDRSEPLVGVSIIVKGTTIATMTDTNGKFSISVPNENTLLIFQYLGFERQEVAVKGQRTLNIILKEDVRMLDEVVVVGYGTQKKTTLTGSVVAINNEQLTLTKNVNTQNMLTGKLPGLRVIQKTSEPGEFTNQFDIRGFGTPLFVVDGVPRGDFPRMDANDIESISILKDGSAAVYGVRAANGVVLITTKSGARQKATIEYSGYYGVQTPAELLQPINSYNRTLLVNEISMRSVTSPTKTHDGQYFADILSGKIPDTDWYGAIMRNTAPQQQHNVSVKGGTDKMDYFVNLGYNNQGSFWVSNSSNYNRYNFRTNLSATIIDGLKASVKLHYMTDQTKRQRYAATSIFAALWRSKPTDFIYANNTEPYLNHPTSGDIVNVVAMIDPSLSGEIDNLKNVLQSNLSLNYIIPFIKGLTTNFMFSYDKANDDNSSFRKEFSEYTYNEANNSYTKYVRNSRTQLVREYRTNYSTLWNFSLNYANKFADLHNVNALLLYEESYSQNYNFRAERFFSIPIPYLFAGDSDGQIGNGSGLSERANRALVGKLAYDFGSKYLFDFTFRYEGSANFPKSGQFAFFPSVSLGYRISEESFFKDNITFVDNLKIRGSYGELGDDSALQYQWIEGFDYPVSASGNLRGTGYYFGNSFVNGLGFRNAPNPDITWYTATLYNLGLDLDVLNGKLGIAFDLFQRDRNGLLATPEVVVPGTFGSGISQANLNGDRTKGFEIELKHRNRVSKNFSYQTTGFVSMTRSMRTKIAQASRNNSYDYWRNNQQYRYNDIWFGYGSAGVFQNWAQISNSYLTSSGTLPGDPIYIDWNGDGIINSNDMYPIATTINPGSSWQDQRNYPLMNFGLTLGAQFKNFDITTQFQGSAMAYVSYAEQLIEPLAWDGNALEILFDRWHPVNPDVHPYDPSIEWISGRYPYGKTRASSSSEFNIQNGAYLRLKNAELGYTLPKNIITNKLKVDNLRLFFNTYNLLTITKVMGLDPEKPTENYGYMYPLNRTFNFGGTITF